MLARLRRSWLALAIIAVAIAASYFAWRGLRPAGLPTGIASGNGRVEAVEIDIATRVAGRVREILVREGDFVTVGQPLAQMDTDQLDAQRREAAAQLQRALIGIETARSVVVQREAERTAAAAVVAQREAELTGAERKLSRTEQLARTDNVSLQVLDDDRARVQGMRAAVSAAKAQQAATEAAISAARSQVVDAEASVEVARHHPASRGGLADSTLKSPRAGRVQFRVAEPGEVLAAGGRVLNWSTRPTST